jgi:hypothetical protein
LAAVPLSEGDIREFARQFNTHPAIIIGRLQQKRLLSIHAGRQFMAPLEFES